MTGKECELTGFMRGSESKLGRSNVIDLNKPNGVNFRQVDHRTLQALVINNTKYLCK